MATGVKIDSEVINKFNEFKMKNSDRYMFFKVSDDKKSIVLEKSGSIGETYSDFLSKLPANDCRYAVVNVEYDAGTDGKRSKIVFVNWAPETAPIKNKMLYAGTKNDVKKCLVGISIEIQGTDMAEVDEQEVLSKLKQISK